MNTSDGASNRFLFVGISVFITLSLCLGTVWINVERANIGYKLKEMKVALGKLETHNAKLEVERDNLLSPYRLSVEAEEMGMRLAAPGQLRYLGDGDVFTQAEPQ
jgi:hypothetical protein